MHQRQKQPRPKSADLTKSDFILKTSRMPLLNLSRSVWRTLCSWIGSFVKLFLIIGFFIMLVYLYDERIVYGFARDAGWAVPGNYDWDHEEREVISNFGMDNGVGNMRHKDIDVKEENDVGLDMIQPALKESHDMQNKLDYSIADENEFQYHILQVLTNSHQKPHLKKRFDVCARSILTKSSVNLFFHFVVDKPSEDFIMDCLQQITDEGISKSKFQFSFLNIDDLGHKILPHVGDLQAQLKGSHPYFQDSIFFLSLGIHQHILPSDIKQLIITDTDLKFMSDIKHLFELFNDFGKQNVMGIAHEQQPVYRHLFSLYRSQNKGTIVGDPPPDGLTGFNSGVMLLDFEKMRNSLDYKEALSVDFIKKYSEKYNFKGHLGDQDFFTLVSMEKQELFYILPCSWNKQLCIWWKDKGYQNVFDLYFQCPDPIHIYHGNCNTDIPY